MTTYSDIKFDYFGEVLGNPGYGLQARRFLKPLIDGGAQVKLIPDEDYLPPHMKISDPYWLDLIEKSKNLPDNDIRISYCLPTRARFSDKNKTRIMWAMWETNEYPKEWAQIINRDSNYFFAGCDALVNSAKKANIQVPIIPMYPTLDTSLWSPTGPKLSIADIPDDSVKFLFIGNFIPRKNFEQLIHAFSYAFHLVRDAVLIIKTWSGANNAEGKKHICDAMRSFQHKLSGIYRSKICVIADLLPEEKVIDLIRTADVYTSVSKGEGFDLPMMQAMSMEKLIVANNFLAHGDYLTDQNSIITPHCLTPCVEAAAPLYDSYQMWSIPDMGKYIEGLQQAYRLVKEGKAGQYGVAARATIDQKYGVQNNTERAARLIREIRDGKHEKKEAGSKILIKELV